MRYLSLFLLPVCLLAGCTSKTLDFSMPEKTLDTASAFLKPKHLEEFKQCFSQYDNEHSSDEDFLKEMKWFRELRKAERCPTEYYKESGNQFASIYYIKYGNRKLLLYNFVKETDGWKIADYLRYRVFLTTPGEPVNGLRASLSSSKRIYHKDERLEDLKLEITLTNVGDRDIRIIPKWEYGENILIKMVRIADFQEASPWTAGGFVHYIGKPGFLTLKPGESITKKLTGEDAVSFSPFFDPTAEGLPLDFWFGQGRYQIFFVYVSYMGFYRMISVHSDEWKGRVTSEPIEIEVVP